MTQIFQISLKGEYQLWHKLAKSWRDQHAQAKTPLHTPPGQLLSTHTQFPKTSHMDFKQHQDNIHLSLEYSGFCTKHEKKLLLSFQIQKPL